MNLTTFIKEYFASATITDGKGMGFGLYSTSLLARDAGLKFEIRSCNNMMILQNGTETISESKFWQGKIVYLQLQTRRLIRLNL